LKWTADMRPTLIKAVNCAWLILVLIGFPAIARTHVAGVEVSSSPAALHLMAWGLAFAAIANALMAAYLLKEEKEQRLCLEWCLGCLCLLGVVWGLSHGYLSFEWLKGLLHWLRNRF
jgi:hypothetical protein